MANPPLLRLTDNLWQYTPEPAQTKNDILLSHIRIQTPNFTAPLLGYAVASSIGQSLQVQNITALSQLEKPFYVQIESSVPQVAGNWKVEKVSHSTICDRVKQAWPMTEMYPDRRIVRIEASKVSTAAQKAIATVVDDTKSLLHQSLDYEGVRINDRLEAASFDDPFTKLATLCLQTVDPNFVSEEKVLASYRFVLKEEKLSLQLLSNAIATEGEKEENRQTVTAFREYVLTEFGKKRLEYVDAAYGFSLDALIKEGKPLTPDHVFKVNIGMNNVELSDVQAVLNKLIDFRNNPPESTKYYFTPNAFENDTCLSLAEFRNLINHVKKTYPHLFEEDDGSAEEAIKRFLNTLPTPQEGEVPVQTLEVDLFNILVSFVMPDTEARTRAFTGRKICHLAIMGSNTMGDPDIFNPSRDLFELMHIYEQMQKKEDWSNFYELLSHVVTKKTLIRKTPPQELQPGKRHWHVGSLLPAPATENGEARWYYVKDCYDDGQGNINYVFDTACDNYRVHNKPLPLIKAYRSTASDGNAFDSVKSIAADLNPYGSPGSIDPQDSFQMEKGDFFKRTMPLWVAKLLHAEKEQSSALYKEALSEYLVCIQCTGNTPKDVLDEARRLCHPDQIRTFLRNEAVKHKELPEHKVGQDIACIGHSLGGALAQFGVYFFGPRLHRIPLEGQKFICYSSRGPAIDTTQDAAFMKFCQTHAKTLQALNQKWEIIHDFSAGDLVPQSGHSHLGTTGYKDADSSWCTITTSVFQPLETAKALEITTISAHGRRSGCAIVGRDFTRTFICPQELHEYDHAWFLSRRLKDIFGNTCFISPKITEFGRELFARLSRPGFVLAEKIHTLGTPPAFSPPEIKRNRYGGFALHYTA